ncbi:XRE family transcriptional regulator [Pseudarthrobacter phenanthrenivorans]|uniref:XRE family transcriptional regulator n=1 Tax=Pseudarthrobacter phenanthrenivorans TaxID=361575 RepID=A0A3B0G658_PSEPS|nr:helix-turn-helix transcriptional regulator [Pseudarthrobacter phenanthrenivorans]RKO27650.1 XRE family transcriptional regulator [Pseudarthrobacter phenanthrenivorans]
MPESDESVVPGAEDEARFIASVKRLREKQGWSQGELARRMAATGWAGFHQTTISRIEKAERPLRLSEARALAEIFETPLEEMLTPPREAAIVSALDEVRGYVGAARDGMAASVNELLQSLDMLRDIAQEAEDALAGEWENESLRAKTVRSLEVSKELLSWTPDTVLKGIVRGKHQEKA